MSATLLAIVLSSLAGPLQGASPRAPAQARASASHDVPPDSRSFGYKGAWIAARRVTPRDLARALQLENVVPASWAEGLRQSYDPDPTSHRTYVTEDAAVRAEYAFPETEQVFVTPPIHEWTLAVGQQLAFFRHFAFKHVPADRAPERLLPFLESLSRGLQTEVQYFFTHRVPECHTWVLADRGRIVRAYGCCGGDVWLSRGPLTPGEAALGLRLPARTADVDGDGMELPSEESVTEVAAHWSVDPTRLDEIRGIAAHGLLGHFRSVSPTSAPHSTRP